MSSSESSSSEDEEETKKINEAIIPTDLFSTLTSSIPQQPQKTNKNKSERSGTDNSNGNDNGNSMTGHVDTVKNDTESSILNSLARKFKKTERRVDTAVLKLNSNRPDKITDDRSAYHATTPGFRAHIEKRLQLILDSDVEACVRDSVWNKQTVNKEKKQPGIKLFSDVKSLCYGNTETRHSQDVRVVKSPPKILPRKRKLNSNSSESSDDEVKINACVFTVDDIMHENRMLENLAKSGVEQSKKGSIEGDLISSVKKSENDIHASDGQKKMDPDGDGNGVETTKEKKKKKKIKKESQDNQDVTEVTYAPVFGTESNELASKKKKKKRKKRENNNV